MSVYTASGFFAHELAASRTRTRWCMAGSVAVHALLLLALLLLPRALPSAPSLTEFTLLDPGDLEAGSAAPAAPARAAVTETGALATETRDESFRRMTRSADVEPEPQTEDALSDRLAARLATLQDGAATRVTGAAEAQTRAASTSAAAAPTAATEGMGGPSVNLHRGGSPGAASPLALTREGGGHASAPALATLGPGTPTAAQAAAPAAVPEAGARRVLAGASMSGPIANRPVITYRTPVYPEWAKHDMVEGSVTLYFLVRPDGSVKENILVQRTAGFDDFDESARTALRAWRFAPLAGGRTGEQWGTITFNFRLQEAG